ncbi:MAG: hypothetical protein P4N60_20440, partial [Verrucomicrobiae bacterium]|nr:hypothetical protein [Verrucomicrobiae bacterium]
LLDAPPFTQCQNRMKHFLWNHKVTTLTAPPQLFQTFLPITNVEEAKMCGWKGRGLIRYHILLVSQLAAFCQAIKSGTKTDGLPPHQRRVGSHASESY